MTSMLWWYISSPMSRGSLRGRSSTWTAAGLFLMGADVSGEDYILGVDIGGTEIKIVRVTPEGEVLDVHRIETKENTDDVEVDDWPAYVHMWIDSIQEDYSQRAIVIGISAPGLVASDNRSIAWMQGRMEALQGVDWTEVFELKTIIPVINDAHAALLGECWKGPAAGYRNAIMLTLGTGVGGAILVNGELLQGGIGRAGHLGHICLDAHGEPDIVNTPGSLEDAIGNCTIEKRSGGRFTSTHALVDAHASGDEDATRVWLESVHHLACALVSFINIVDPEVMVLGGGIAGAGDLLLEPLRAEMSKLEWRPHGDAVPIVIASLGDLAGAYGAAYFALLHGKEDE
ncbi:MAG TPA: ROK family protein [Candidatus Hydrogenedentes bacterium]|nr:ROK family protein [Candidatus Hydrogenedentota bacterium]